jgi:hypothetical protein
MSVRRRSSDQRMFLKLVVFRDRPAYLSLLHPFLYSSKRWHTQKDRE